MSPAEILEFAGRRLFEAIGISDHYETRGALEARLHRAADRSLPEVIISQEVSAGDHFHLLVIGDAQPWPEQNRCQLLDALAEHHQKGGAVILAHPWTMPRTGWAAEYLKLLLDQEILDGVEMLNASITELSRSELADLKCLWEEEFAPRRLGTFGGSDFHHLRKGQLIGTGRTYLKVEEPHTFGIMEAILARRAVAGLCTPVCSDLDWLGSGFQFYCGCTPWYEEILHQIDFLRGYIATLSGSGRYRKGFLTRLLADGQFQQVYDLIV